MLYIKTITLVASLTILMSYGSLLHCLYDTGNVVNGGKVFGMDVNHYTHNGTLQNLTLIGIRATLFDGAGTLDGVNIVISCNEFNYTGTISCDGVCIIRAAKDFKPELFKRKGSGTFGIIISPKEDDIPVTEDAILSYANRVFMIYPTQTEKSNRTIDEIKKIRRLIARNFLNEKEVFKKIQQKIDQEITLLYSKRVSLPHKNKIKYIGLSLMGTWMAGLAGSVGVIVLSRPSDPNVDYAFRRGMPLSLLTFIVSLPFLFKYDDDERTDKLNKELQEKCNIFIAIQEKIDNELATVYIPEDKIIKLQ